MSDRGPPRGAYGGGGDRGGREGGPRGDYGDRGNFDGPGRGGRGGGRGGRGGPRGGPRDDHPPTAPQIDNRRERTRVKDEIAQYFKDNDIEEGSTQLEEKMPPGQSGQTGHKFLTNAFGIKLENIPYYQYHVEIAASRRAGDPKPVFLTRRGTDDCVAVDRKARCREAFKLMLNVATDVFLPGNTVLYDLQATLITTKLLPKQELTFKFDKILFEQVQYLSIYQKLDFVIRQCNTERQLTTGDLTMADLTDFEEFDRSHQAYIEMATSQHVLMHPEVAECLGNGKIYLVEPQKFVDPKLAEDANNFAPDKYLGLGCKKSAKYVEGPAGRGHKNVVLFIDPIKTPFWRSMTVVQFLQGKQINPMNIQQASHALRGLHIYNPRLSGKRIFQVTAVINEYCGTKTFRDKNGRETTIANYFYDQYGIQCDGRLPLVKGKGKFDLLPMDGAVIDDNQPVPKNRMGNYEDTRMIKIAAQPPAVQTEEIVGYKNALGLNELQQKGYGLKLLSQLKVDGRILAPPRVSYGDERGTLMPAGDGAWAFTKGSLRGGTFKAWALIHNGTENIRIQEYQMAFLGQCRNMGITMPTEPVYVDHGDGSDHNLEHQFQTAKDKGVDFIAFITDKQIKNQPAIKYYERKFEITTQNVTTRTASDASGGRGSATLQNICNKTNMKAGGLNYTLKTSDTDMIEEAFGKGCIIVGIALSHAGSVDEVQRSRGGAVTSNKLSSVGYAANMGKDFYEFFGNCVPNNAYRSEIMDLIPGIIRSTVLQYYENKGHYPSSMVIYLNGNSEGEFSMLKRFEVPLVRKQLLDIIGREIPLTIIIPQRAHVARIYKANVDPRDKPVDQNLPVGVVIDTGLTHPAQNEFYLNAHSAIMGTARTPKYSILYNINAKAGSDAIQQLTYILCYAYQIINSPTSLPAPLFIAMDYAERGSKIYNYLGLSNPDDVIGVLTYDTSEVFRNKRVNA